jgi:protein ImuB
MRRILALWFPFLPADRWRREASHGAAPGETPFALIETLRGANRLFAVNAAAAALGLAPGLTLADARARVPELAAAPADREADARFLARLGALCERFTPSVAVEAPDGLLLDVTGCAHLFGGEAALREAACAWLARLGVETRACLAGIADAASALARYGRPGIVPPYGEGKLLRPLPVAALGLGSETAMALARAGLKTVGDLEDRPSVVLSARFGEELTRRLGRLFGREEAPLVPLRAAPLFWFERRFAAPMAHRDGLEAVLLSLLDEAARVLEAHGQGGRRFEAICFRSDGAIRRVGVETARPSREAKAILRLFRERLEALSDPLDPGFGFDALRLAITEAGALAAYQPDLDGSGAEAASVGALLDRLSARLGRDRVIRFAGRDSHDPDREAHLRPALNLAAPERSGWRAPEAGEPPLRPLHVFRPPQPIEAVAEVPDGPPVRFCWRRLWRDVARAEGPERIAPEWWRGAGEQEMRDYYRIEDADGRRYWVFRRGFYGAEGARWFVQGLFA